jgi:hypothetical protein
MQAYHNIVDLTPDGEVDGGCDSSQIQHAERSPVQWIKHWCGDAAQAMLRLDVVLPPAYHHHLPGRQGKRNAIGTGVLYVPVSSYDESQLVG